jgi:hypothetical protein
MATLGKLILILEVCQRYSSGDMSVAAEHDVIYLPLTNETVISQEDEEALLTLGAWKSDVDCWAVYT